MAGRCSPQYALSYQRQRGAIGIMAALVMLMALTFLMLAIDTGRLYLEKRSLQRVADMAALEAVLRDGNCQAGAGATTAQSYAAENAQVRNGFTLDAKRTLVATCGNVDESGSRRSFLADITGSAIQVDARREVPASLILGGLFGEQVTIAAQAVAAKREPLAALTLRTTLATVDSTQSPLLNALVGGLLGGSVNLSAVGWDGLAKSQINLVDYLDQLAINQGITVGDYQSVLDENLSLGTLLDVAATTLQQAGTSADLDAAIAGLNALSAVVPAASPLLQLSDLINVQSATQKAGLDTALNLLQLVQGTIELANSKSAAIASLPITVPGLSNVTLNIKVIEPPQLSAIGNPELAKADPYGPNQIAVRSAQIRTALSIDLSGTTNALDSLLQPAGATSSVGSFLNSVLNLNLLGAVGDLVQGILCGPCASKSISAAQVLPGGRIDVMLDVAEAQARVTDYSCTSSTDKTLEVDVTTSALNLAVGQLGDDPADVRDKVFNSPNLPVAAPLALIKLGEQRVRPTSCLLTICFDPQWQTTSGSWVSDRKQAAFTVRSGLGLTLNSSVIGSGVNAPPLLYSAPSANELPNVGETPYYQSANANNNVAGSLATTLAGIDLEPYASSSPGLLDGLITTSVNLISSLLGSLEGVIQGVLAPLVDPLVDTLLNGLGIELAKADVGANLTCGSRAELLL
ncbi:pilus assembly protein TadG-related protein [Pseudomonas segetis]|uniref:Putative Tad-like Flp pilus-assembly n=1 Tax=Pseudomonas segetis TaxID=298908 RepID=A0A239DBN0_9PSED|nr:TadG family pilus assembly protein [Pseudomonas segetis]SNS29468.1 Putative Tad-like Flp pilus-assembly [Pseudomonas segetis]